MLAVLGVVSVGSASGSLRHVSYATAGNCPFGLGSRTLHELDLPSGRSRLLAGDAYASDVSPDGTEFAIVTGAHHDRLWVRAVRGPSSLLLPWPAEGGAISEVRWAPNGRMLAFASTAGLTGAIWLVNRDGSGLRRFLDGEVGDPQWSPDSKALTFLLSRRGRTMLGVKTLDGRRDLAVAPADPEAPHLWSPSGAWIAYSPDGNHVHLIRPDGSGDRTIAAGRSPSWSPDGRKLVLEPPYPDPTPPTVVVKAFAIVDLRGRVLGSFEPHYADSAVWSPRGDLIAYALRTDWTGNYSDLAISRPDGSGSRKLTRYEHPAGSDFINGIEWARTGPLKGKRLFYWHDICAEEN